MPTIKFSASAQATAATSITVPFGGSPAVGDLVVVFLLVDNEIITHQPGWASEFTATPNPWFKLEGLRAPNSATLTGWYHTWNASDSGSSTTFAFAPAPSLGIGDKDVSSANALAVAVVFDGSHSTAILEHNCYGTAQDNVGVVLTTPMKLAASLLLSVVANNGSNSGYLDTDPLATLVNGADLPTPAGGMSIDVFERVNSPKGYQTTLGLLSFASVGITSSLMTLGVSVSDNQPQLYNAPFIEEGPMGHNALMLRYRLNRYFTVLNNGGTFTAVRYQSTDQIAAATQVFTNNQPISSTDRTNILNAGVGGDFQAVS